MKNLLLAVSLGIFLTACGQSSNSEEPSNEPLEHQESQNEEVTVVVSPEEFEARMNETPGLLIDVRTPDEFEEGHIKGSVMIDYTASDFEEKISALDKNQTVYVYCRSGGRSGRSAAIMEEMGFTSIVDLSGGVTAWIESGRTVEEGGN